MINFRPSFSAKRHMEAPHGVTPTTSFICKSFGLKAKAVVAINIRTINNFFISSSVGYGWRRGISDRNTPESPLPVLPWRICGGNGSFALQGNHGRRYDLHVCLSCILRKSFPPPYDQFPLGVDPCGVDNFRDSTRFHVLKQQVPRGVLVMGDENNSAIISPIASALPMVTREIPFFHPFLLVKELPALFAIATNLFTVVMRAEKLLNFRKKIEKPRIPHIELIM